MKTGQQMQVSAIMKGTVIDHIPADNLFKVINFLNLENLQTLMTFGSYLESKRLGKKAVIKLANVFFLDEDINKIALIAPQAKLNIIDNYKVIEKKQVGVPKKIKGLVKCMNPKCISNHEPILQKFDVLKNNDKISLKCHYCEKITDQEHMNWL